MFWCKLCDKGLSAGQDILGTFCGHLYHQKCLDHHLINSSHLCPTCNKSLRVDLNCISSGYAVLSLYPEERQIPNELPSINHDGQERGFERNERSQEMKENIVLKQKLVEVIQTLVFMQNELKTRDKHDTSIDPSRSPFSQQITPQGHQTESFGAVRSFETKSPQFSDMVLQNILQSGNREDDDSLMVNEESKNNAESDNACFSAPDTPELVILQDKAMLNNSLTEEEKNRILRSKRREYLTWRNKAQTWINKMKAGSERLFKTEEAFTPEEYLQQLRLFFNKIYHQSMIVEEAKQAAMVYIIIDTVSDEEMNEVNEKIHYFTQTCTAILNEVLQKLNTLEAKHANLEAELRLTEKMGHRGSSVGWSEDDEDNDKETVVERDVSIHPTVDEKSSSSRVVMLLPGLELEDSDTIDRTPPVFV